MSDGQLQHRETSPTASTVGNELYGPSGVMKYRVVLGQSGGARTATTVEAATGDDAASQALAKYPGWKVAYVGPATGHDTPMMADDAE